MINLIFATQIYKVTTESNTVENGKYLDTYSGCVKWCFYVVEPVSLPWGLSSFRMGVNRDFLIQISFTSLNR